MSRIVIVMSLRLHGVRCQKVIFVECTRCLIYDTYAMLMAKYSCPECSTHLLRMSHDMLLDHLNSGSNIFRGTQGISTLGIKYLWVGGWRQLESKHM
jgi:hypothetical protein